jgi:IclR family mhp operon transcriptional activator
MWQPKVKTIAGLQKGLIVLDALHAAENGKSLHDLYIETSIPKATLLRVLVTLEQHGAVWRRHVDGNFCASYALQRRALELDPTSKLAECAADELDSLQAKVQWPSDIAIRCGYGMMLCETNRTSSYITVHKDKLGFEINILLSAVGRAYLAFCPTDERDEILAGLRNSKRPGDALAHDPARLNVILDATRTLGYGVRDRSFGGHYDKPKSQHDDRLAAIAVPIAGDQGLHGCLNMVWIESLFTVEEIAEKYLETLKKTAARIARKMT